MTDTEGVEAVEGLVFVFHIIVEEGARGLELLDAMSPQGILNYWTVEFFFFFFGQPMGLFPYRLVHVMMVPL